jgi:ATP-dependent Clp protease ATP-binding subunit ClpA
MLSRNLEKTLHRALAYANERRHEYATLEHLLLALTEDQDAIAVFHACAVDLDRLRREVRNYVDKNSTILLALMLPTRTRSQVFNGSSSVQRFLFGREVGKK